MSLKVMGWWALGVAVVFGLGWYVGASGRGAIEQERRAATGRAEFAEARAAVLDARVNLYQTNFGQANQLFESARVAIVAAQARLRQSGDPEQAGQLELAVSHLREAQRLSLTLDAAAHVPADQALRVIDAVSAATAGR